MLHFEKHNVFTMYFLKIQSIHIVRFDKHICSRCVLKNAICSRCVLQNSHWEHSAFLKCTAFTFYVFQNTKVSALRYQNTM